MRAAAAAAALLLTASTAACQGAASPADPLGSESPTPHVDVDTAELRAQKARSGIAECPRVEPREAVDDGLPDITLPCLGGGRDVPLAGLPATAGRPTVVNLWASWCDPCREELPVLQEYAERAAGRVDVIGVDFLDTRPGAALELARRSGVTYPLLADVDADLRAPLRVPGLPMTVVLDGEGRIARSLPGQIHSVGELARLVQDAVGVGLDG